MCTVDAALLPSPQTALTMQHVHCLNCCRYGLCCTAGSCPQMVSMLVSPPHPHPHLWVDKWLTLSWCFLRSHWQMVFFTILQHGMHCHVSCSCYCHCLPLTTPSCHKRAGDALSSPWSSQPALASLLLPEHLPSISVDMADATPVPLSPNNVNLTEAPSHLCPLPLLAQLMQPPTFHLFKWIWGYSLHFICLFSISFPSFFVDKAALHSLDAAESTSPHLLNCCWYD